MTSKPGRPRRIRWIVTGTILAILAGSAAIVVLRRDDGPSAAEQEPVFTARRGPLTIDVSVAGSITNKDKVVLKSELEGRTTILKLVAEGAKVSEGDVLVKLDVSSIEERLVDREAEVHSARAAFIRAREELEVSKNAAASDVETAELAVRFADEDLHNYLEGEYPNQLREMEARITLAEEELERRNETLTWSRVLHREKYLSESELKADELSSQKAKLDLEVAQGKLDLLRRYTFKRQKAQLESDRNQARMALERTKRKASANVLQAEAELTAKESLLKRRQDQVAKARDQIAKGTIVAPLAGTVVYATTGARRWRRHEPISEGREVREGEEIIHLPTAANMIAEVKVHEAHLTRVTPGLAAQLTVDALPGIRFNGTVTRISPLPDPTSAWLNPDLKQYDCELELTGAPEELRTGMNCSARIIVETLDDAVYVPLQALGRHRGKPAVFVFEGGDEPVPRQVVPGMDNNRMVHIIDGLQEGETVWLAPPIPAAAEAAEAVSETPPEMPRPPDSAARDAAGKNTAEKTPQNRERTRRKRNQDRPKRPGDASGQSGAGPGGA